MKKLALVIAIAGLSLASCRKEYTCECTTTDNFLGGVSTSNSTSTIKSTKKKATEVCEDLEQTKTFAGSVAVCELK